MEALRTAYHEAGHAVVAIRLGVAVTSASMRPAVVKVDADTPAPRTALEQIKRQVVIGHAGPVAECRFAGEEWSDRLEFCRVDFARARQRLAKIADGWRRELDFYRARQVAVDLVNENWPQIERVAAALIEHETLSGGEVSEIIQQGRK